MKIFRRLLVTALVIQAVPTCFGQSPSPKHDDKGLEIVEQDVRPDSLQPLYVTERDGRKVRESEVPVDLSYSAFVKTLLTYLDSDTPQNSKRTYKAWTQIIQPIDPEVDGSMRSGFVAEANSNRLLDFGEFQRLLVSKQNSSYPLLNSTNMRGRPDSTKVEFILNLDNPEVLKAEQRLARPVKGRDLKVLASQQLVDRQSAAFGITPIAAIIGLKMLQNTIDDALNRADEIATSQLFAMRSHVATSIQDMNVMFKNRMDQAFDNLRKDEQVAINAAVQLTNESLVAIKRLEDKGYLDASDLLCQSAVAIANFNLLPFFKKTPPPDLMCLQTPIVRDAGKLHERFLTFRGVSLRKGGGYPDTTLIVPTAEKTFTLPAAGGNTILQMPLPGGINGGPNDLTPRGSLIAMAEFNWNQGESDKSNLKSRWMFSIEPYLVNSIDVFITPQIRQTTYQPKSQTFYVEAGGGEQNTATWTVPVDTDGEAVDCWYVVNTKVGNSGILNGPLKTPGGCSVAAIARGPGHGQGGGSFGITLWIRQKFKAEIAGPTWHEMKRIVNQTQKEAVFSYDQTLVPPDSEVIDWDANWRVDVHRNDEEQFSLTTSNKVDTRIGTATMDIKGNLTIKLN